MRNVRTRRSDCPAPVLESLEPRLLLSSQTLTDVDGDIVTVSLSGPGSMVIEQPALVAGNPGILKIALTDVEGSQTTLAIKVTKSGGGDGFVDVGRITGGANAGLHALNAPTTNIVGTGTVSPLAPDGDGSGFGIDLGGYVSSFTVHNITNGADVLAKQGAFYFPTCIPTKFTAWDIGPDTGVTLGSWVDALKVHSWGVHGWLDAKGLTKLDAAGDFGAGIHLFRGPTAGPINIGGSVLSGSIGGDFTHWVFPTDVGAITVGGGSDHWVIEVAAGNISSLTCKGDLSFSSIEARSLGKLSVTGDLPGGWMLLSQVVDPVKMALGTVTIGKTLGNTTAVVGAPLWMISGAVGAITVGASSNDWTFSTPGAVKSLTSKGDLAFATWQALSLGTLAVTGSLVSGAMTLTQTVDPARPALGSAKIGGQVASGGAVNWSVSGNVGATTIGSSTADWSVIAAGSVTSLTVKANLALAGWRSMTLGTLKVAGDMNAGVMRLTQGGTATSSNSIAIGGILTNSTIRAAGSIGSFKAKGMNTANLYAGVDPLGNTGALTNLSAKIGSVNLTGGATAPHWMIGSEIHAGTLGTAFIQGPQSGSGNVLVLGTIPLSVIKIRLFDGTNYTYGSNWPVEAANRLDVQDL